MHGRIVAPVWHNREVHRDFECWSLRKRTIYDPGNYADVGGHGALILPGSLKLLPTRKYEYRFAASGCPKFVSLEEPLCHVASVDFDSERGTILIGNSEGLFCRDPGTLASGKISSEGPASIKVQDFKPDDVTVAVVSSSSITAFRGSEITAKLEIQESIDSFDASPFIRSEIVTCIRNSVRLGETTFNLKSNLIAEDVSFFTNPRHLAVAHSDSVVHFDVRTPGTTSTIVDNKCLNLFPKNTFSSLKVNCRNVNQLFVLSTECLSLWDVRYSTQPMGVFNHYVSRSSELFSMQTLPTEESLFLLVRSNVRSTLFEFDSTLSSPNAALSGPQLQFAIPADIGHYYWDQTGNRVPEDVWKRLSQPIAGSCIAPSRENKDEFILHSFTSTGDWFQQKLRHQVGQETESQVNGEKTFVYGMDGFPLDGVQLHEVITEIGKLQTPNAVKVLPEYENPLARGANTVLMDAAIISRNKCSICCGDGAVRSEESRCGNCGLREAADILNDAWLEGGLIRKSDGLTEEEENRSRELLGQNAAGLAVSDAIRAVWGDVDWRVGEEVGKSAATGDANDEPEPGENVDGFGDDDDD